MHNVIKMPGITLLYKKNKVKCCASYHKNPCTQNIFFFMKWKNRQILVYTSTVLQNTSFPCLMLIMKYQAFSANFPVPAPTALHVFSFIWCKETLSCISTHSVLQRLWLSRAQVSLSSRSSPKTHRCYTFTVRQTALRNGFMWLQRNGFWVQPTSSPSETFEILSPPKHSFLVYGVGCAHSTWRALEFTWKLRSKWPI